MPKSSTHQSQRQSTANRARSISLPDLGLALVAGVMGTGTALLLPKQISGHTLAAIVDFQSPAFFPALGAVFFCCLSVIMAWSACMRPATNTNKHTSNNRVSDDVVTYCWARVSCIALLIMAYTAGVFVIGMISASVVFLVCASLAFGYRNIWMIGALAVCIPALVYFLFQRTLNVLLPSGWLF